MEKQKALKYRADIQGFRALAVIMVIIFHINKEWLPGGFVGVDVFFVISGYLISGIIIKKTENKSFSFWDFMLGRIKRIAPAYFVMLLGCMIVSFFALTHLDFETLLYQLRRTYVFLSNIMFASGSDYFGAKTHENSLLHTWSLSIEMQFYLFLPLLFLLPRKIYKWLLVAMGISLVLYTEYQLRVLDHKQAMYFSLLARVPEFLLGTAVHFVSDNRKIRSFVGEGLGILGLSLIIISACLISESSLFPGLLSLPVCIGTALLLYNSKSFVNRLFGLSLPVYIGELSYSLYLFHWPVLAFARYYHQRYELAFTEILPLLAIIAALSILSYYYIEQRMRHLSNRKILIALSVFTVASVGVWLIVFLDNNKKVELERPFVSNSNIDVSNHAQYSGYKLLGDSKKEDDKILLLGDSHGFVLTPFFTKVGMKNGFNFSYLTTNSVPPLEGIKQLNILPEYRKAYNEAVLISNKQIPSAKIVFVISHFYGTDPALLVHLISQVHRKINKDQHIVIVSDFPRVEHHPYRKYRSITKPSDFKPAMIKNPDIPAEIIAIDDKYENIHLLDLRSPEFFREAPYVNDTLMYYDESHLNYFGSVKYSERVGYRLADLVNSLKAKDDNK